MKLITSLELTATGVDKFNYFFSTYAGDKLDMQATMFDLLDALQERAGVDDALVYELGGQYTNSGREELLFLHPEDVSVTEEDSD